jgi:hypothetical protein
VLELHSQIGINTNRTHTHTRFATELEATTCDDEDTGESKGANSEHAETVIGNSSTGSFSNIDRVQQGIGVGLGSTGDVLSIADSMESDSSWLTAKSASSQFRDQVQI